MFRVSVNGTAVKIRDNKANSTVSIQVHVKDLPEWIDFTELSIIKGESAYTITVKGKTLKSMKAFAVDFSLNTVFVHQIDCGRCAFMKVDYKSVKGEFEASADYYTESRLPLNELTSAGKHIECHGEAKGEKCAYAV